MCIIDPFLTCFWNQNGLNGTAELKTFNIWGTMYDPKLQLILTEMQYRQLQSFVKSSVHHSFMVS